MVLMSGLSSGPHSKTVVSLPPLNAIPVRSYPRQHSAGSKPKKSLTPRIQQLAKNLGASDVRSLCLCRACGRPRRA